MKNQLRAFLITSLLLTFLASCKKFIAIDTGLNNPKTGQVVKYTIPQGEHYADQNSFQQVQYDELRFTVKFDSTAIYQNLKTINQEDINKLYGFSDNNAQHQQFSARFGWNWAREALRLYAYIYNNGQRDSRELCSIQIGSEYECSIRVSSAHYIFSVNNVSLNMPRNSITSKGTGYKLYPYFGGDEPAPHDINIWIKEL